MADELPSPDHVVGDTGHTNDHNEIAQALVDITSDILALQVATPNVFSTTGGNVCNIPGTATSFALVNLLSGNRDTAADTFDVFYGAAKVFSLNGYGEIRLAPGAANHVAAIIQGLPSQTGDLLQLQNSSGTVLFRIGADGSSSHGPQYFESGGVIETWHSLPALQGSWSTYPGTVGKYRLVSSPPNSMQISAQFSPGNESNGFTVATFPVGYRPQSIKSIMATADVLGSGSPRFLLGADGTFDCFGISFSASRIGVEQVVALDL